ncbi:aspartate--tRNA ligase 2, cytoplasmic-like [Silene latifolia]|uniref:aspartate--tRNA ligase 2, cytoplasmic-like n=1 Tax=Silene latifolia TaxID=37657 RepID=UPI003D77A7DA
MSSSEPNPIPPPEGSAPEPELSKKAAKKEAAKQEKLRKKQEAAAAAAAAAAVAEVSISDPLADKYGDLELQSKTVSGNKWTDVKALSPALNGTEVLIGGRVHAVRAVSKKMSFLVVRDTGSTVQCVLTVKPGSVSEQMVRFSNSLSRESIVDVFGTVSVPNEPIKGTTQQVEIQVSKIYCVSRAAPVLPINIEDAARSDAEIEEALKEGKQLVRVNQDTRLTYRFLDVRTLANQAIFRLQSEINYKFTDFLRNEGFVGIHTPKLMGGTSEGGAAVFRLDYKGKPACLAQSPQLHKQMSICGDFMRVYEIGAVFRAEDSFTHRHLCEFTGLDAEMVIREHYSEVMDVVDNLFVALFDHLNKDCKEELEAVSRQYPFTPLKYLRGTLRLTFEEGVQMLKEAGTEVDPFGDLNTETEKKLGALVREKYETDFYILHRYPLAIRPFYTMPCYDDPNYSNSFDVFIRGEEIISGAQRVHDPVLLEQRAKACGIDVDSISSYLDSFKYGAWRHGGFGVGLERVVMLFCNLNNIRKTSLFPRDPQRLAP